MELFFTTIIFLLLFWAGILSARLCCYKKQIRHMLKELQIAEKSETNILLTSAIPIGQTEDVIHSWNRILERIRQDKEYLNSQNRSYRESIISISHDIRTPLTSAKGYMQMLQDDSFTKNPLTQSKQKDYARIVERRLDDLSAMLDQLFLYARIEAGELPLQMEEINICSLFAETVAMFYQNFAEKNCEPKIQIPGTPCHITADRQALTRIIENIVKNALVHGTGGYEISLQTTGETVIMRVANQTDSIHPEDIPHVFDRFYTTDLSRSRKTTGLGLAIVKELTGQMGGKAAAGLSGNLFSIEITFFANPIFN